MKATWLVIVLLFLGCKNDTNDKSVVKSEKVEKAEMASTTVFSGLEVYDFEGLQPFLNKQDDKTYVVNFWATWCAPCVKELPYFEALNKEYKDKNVEVLLVSLDFPRYYEERLKPFIVKNNIQSKVLAFDDTDQNKWIPAINKDWSGAIPATIIYNSKERKFYERSFNYEELETELKHFLK